MTENKRKVINRKFLIINNLDNFLFRNKKDKDIFLTHMFENYYQCLFDDIDSPHAIKNIIAMCETFLNIPPEDVAFRPKKYSNLDNFFFKDEGK